MLIIETWDLLLTVHNHRPPTIPFIRYLEANEASGEGRDHYQCHNHVTIQLLDRGRK